MERLLSTPLLVVVALCAASTARAQTRAPAPETDTQLWSDVQLAVPLGKTVDSVWSGTLRLGRNVKRPVDERVGLSFSFKLGKYLTAAPGYLRLWTQPSPGREGTEDRLLLPVTVRFPLGKTFVLSDRNQFERRYRKPQGVSTRYRNRLQIDRPVKFGKTALTLFAADEVFYDWSVNDWVRNRFSLGFSRKFNPHFTEDFYYLRQNDGRSRPGDLHAVGTTIRLRL
ncbi:MAG TPA: DUF2490 domain-containing protein [Pyrinomonadaceae bacterium]|jgi:hypothetical protein